ncbi:prepilin-type N-terminal cleavage/methylation domain-containing protein [Pelotomaculum isophthalicicum JI]|uniref:Prepilin-type N-terminal cleavage/methylation domain-containing protein n=1 Tax=Pelotomaculum isophthalicicum JI TaxID=947010 RepID=A0A9X4H5P2_9FIRM|nr:prepilin-type N-terminal cleavage/methylation domain-containing protein [Pelotomaculum isophthalicicum]MDF9408612.1 prepilin-type N-terminal cleavage/methylation domain-containing protein [Pelotomaculum isophthalicicum JI]
MRQIIIQNERGFTLIEVLVALAILAVSLVAMMDSFTTASRGNADVYRYNVALSLAQSKMEEIKNNPFISVADIGPVDFTEESDYSEFAGYQYTVAVTDNNLINKTVVVTVYYNDEGTPKEVALTGEITRR